MRAVILAMVGSLLAPAVGAQPVECYGTGSPLPTFSRGCRTPKPPKSAARQPYVSDARRLRRPDVAN